MTNIRGSIPAKKAGLEANLQRPADAIFIDRDLLNEFAKEGKGIIVRPSIGIPVPWRLINEAVQSELKVKEEFEVYLVPKGLAR